MGRLTDQAHSFACALESINDPNGLTLLQNLDSKKTKTFRMLSATVLFSAVRVNQRFVKLCLVIILERLLKRGAGCEYPQHLFVVRGNYPRLVIKYSSFRSPLIYQWCIYLKFSDRHVWANPVDPDHVLLNLEPDPSQIPQLFAYTDRY